MNRRDFFKLAPLGALAFSVKPATAQPRRPSPIQHGIRVVWGVPPEIKAVERDGIEGKMRLRFGNKMAGRAYFKTATGIRCFIIEVRDGQWVINPRLEQNRAQRPPAVLSNNKNL